MDNPERNQYAQMIKTVFLLWCALAASCLLQPVFAAEIWVAPSGSDANPGTKDQPLASLTMALRKVREMRRLNSPAVQEAVHIIIRGGLYRLEEPVFIRPEDAGTAASPTYIEAAPGETPVFSGGAAVTGWRKAPRRIAGLPAAAQGRLWEAPAPVSGGSYAEFRQLWINGRKAIRARDRNPDSMSRILSWDHAAEQCWIPKPVTADLSRVQGMEMFIHQWWAIAILRVKSIEVQGDSARLSFYQPESRVQSEHPWPAPWISKKTGNSAFYLSNTIQFLDQPGEWYLDKPGQKVYYWPREGETMPQAEAIVPVLETLLRMEGTPDAPVAHVHVKGISFMHAGWTRPSHQGHVPHQTGMYMLDAYKLKIPGTPDKKGLENQAWVGRPAAAVEAAYTRHTSFEGCRFEHIASTGLDYKEGNYYDEIAGNLFRDIGGTGILVGKFSDETQEVHLPYNPTDQREITTGTRVHNNLITNVTNEDWGCVGIGAGYVRNIRIAHNEISDLSYTGISMGWGWTPTINVMRNNIIEGNYIHHYGKHNYDVSGIYTLSAQPGSVIAGNRIDSIYKATYAHDPHHWFYLYCDEGSSYFTVKDNWCPAPKFLQNANGPNNIWQNNGPGVADSIKQVAGIQPAWSYLLKERPGRLDAFPVNKVSKSIIEITGEGIDSTRLLEITRRYNLSADNFYSWKDHYVIYGILPDMNAIRRRLAGEFPTARVKLYEDAFYEFNRARCPDTREAKEWENVILTANLVKDPALQQEYLQYHATQFTRWPEVAMGFCRAEFQQLQVFRNERQLMLVISIPKGKTLDELNPKTTENNPRVDAWNELMKKYQEGIPGTQPGEVWVFLQPFKPAAK